MKINRHNYEEYFILYMDKELGLEERRVVEDFVDKHPDLKDELDFLLQSKLNPDLSIVFDNKTELLRENDSPSINMVNYEEWLTGYIDNELTTDQRSQVENFVESTPQAKQEFLLLQKTKLEPESITFPYKEELYRRTEKVRVITARWWRIAAAAVLLIAIGISAVVIINNNNTPIVQPGKGVASEKGINATQENSLTDNNSKKPDIATQPINSMDEQNSDGIAEAKIATKKVDDQKVVPGIKNLKNELPVQAKEEKNNLIADNQNNQPPSNNLPAPEYSYSRPSNFTNVTDVIENEKSATEIFKPSFAVTSKVVPTYINGGSDRIDQTDEGKNKLRGFFRKVTRLFERTTNINATDDDDRLLIGAVAVKLK